MKIDDPAKFVKLWLSDSTQQEIADAFSCSTAYVGLYAIKLKTLGVNLPDRRRRIIVEAADVAKLNAIVAKNVGGK